MTCHDVYTRLGTGVNIVKKRDWTGRALLLFFKLNADAMNYTPLSHRGRRAARLMPRLRAALKA